MKHDLHIFLDEQSDRLAKEYERIYRRAADDPGTAGDQGEQNWAEVLRQWLPAYYHVVTKGRIINENGELSPQVDVVVLKPEYPRALLDTKIYMSAGVAAAFECKLTLTKADIEKTLANAVKIKRLCLPRLGEAFDELNAPIVYGLLSHSHSWKSTRTKVKETIAGHLKAGVVPIDSPRELIDFVCVADLALWSLRKIVARSKRHKGRVLGQAVYFVSDRPDPRIGYKRVYDGQFAACSAFVAQFLSRLSWENEALEGISAYLRDSNYPAHAGWPSVTKPLTSDFLSVEAAAGVPYGVDASCLSLEAPLPVTRRGYNLFSVFP